MEPKKEKRKAKLTYKTRIVKFNLITNCVKRAVYVCAHSIPRSVSLWACLYLYQMREIRPQPLILQWRKNHLPYDIVLNILERLHVKSVIRFKFVCKFWDSLITTPYFISSHLNVNNKDSHDNANGYVIHMGSSRSSDRQVCTVALDSTFDRIFEVQIPQIFLLILSEWSVPAMAYCVLLIMVPVKLYIFAILALENSRLCLNLA